MPRHRIGFQVVTQTHLERVDSRHWKLIISDGVPIFKPKHVNSFIMSKNALQKLCKQIQNEIKD